MYRPGGPYFKTLGKNSTQGGVILKITSNNFITLRKVLFSGHLDHADIWKEIDAIGAGLGDALPMWQM